MAQFFAEANVVTDLEAIQTLRESMSSAALQTTLLRCVLGLRVFADAYEDPEAEEGAAALVSIIGYLKYHPNTLKKLEKAYADQ